MFKNYLIYLLFCVFFSGCKNPQKENVTVIHTWKIDYEDPAITYRTQGDAVSGNYYAHADRDNIYCHGLIYPLPDSLNGSFVRVCFDFWGRIKGRRFGQSLVISLQKQNDLFLWEPYDLNHYTFSKDKWIHFSDSMQFFCNFIDKKNVELKVFGFNSFRKSELDMDDLNITLKKVQKTGAN